LLAVVTSFRARHDEQCDKAPGDGALPSSPWPNCLTTAKLDAGARDPKSGTPQTCSSEIDRKAPQPAFHLGCESAKLTNSFGYMYIISCSFSSVAC